MGKNLLILLLAIGWAATAVLWLVPRPTPDAPPPPAATLAAPEPSRPAPAEPVPDPVAVDDPEPIVVEPEPSDVISRRLAGLKKRPGFEAASVGFCLLTDSAIPKIAYQADRVMIPASTLKTVTSATALEILGPDFRFATQLAAAEPLPATGELAGDLVLLGGGDPSLTTETLAAWAKELAKRGLRKVQGRVIGDERWFPEALASGAWDWGDISNYYGAGPSGLNLDQNRFLALFDPAKKLDQSAFLRSIDPALPWVKFDNFMLTGQPDSGDQTCVYGGPYASRLAFRGTVPLGESSFPCRGAIPDPSYYAAFTLTKLLAAEGITVAGEPSTFRRLALEGRAPPSAPQILLTHQSPPLTSLIRHLHRISDNLYAECLFQMLAKHSGRAAPAVIMDHWKPRGVEFLGLRMEDGSGLARANLIRPLDLALVLQQARSGPHGAAFVDTLNTHADGKIHWKSGAMSRVRCWCGYVQGRSGAAYTFAMMFNHFAADGAEAQNLRDALVREMLRL